MITFRISPRAEDKACVPYARLAEKAAGAGQLEWVLRPKHHEPWHHTVPKRSERRVLTCNLEFNHPRGGRKSPTAHSWTAS